MTFSNRSVNLANASLLLALHGVAGLGLLMLFGGLPGAPGPRIETLGTATALYLLNSLALVCGLHALWSHRSYKTTRPVEAVYLLLSTLGLTGSAYWWARDHRLHHAFQDTEKDPHNIHEGFFYAHLGWLFLKKSPAQVDAKQRIFLADLERNELVMWQHRHYRRVALPLALGLPTLVCGLLWGDWLGGFLIAGGLRVVFFLHCVFCVNSVAHTFGKRPHAHGIRATDNWLVSILLVGVGHHNYHHRFPADYRNAPSLRGWNPGAWLIWLLAKTGLAWDLKTADATPARTAAAAEGTPC
jgi:stearoyl-CoA desaturase (delta-9 desaturase)